MASGQGRLDESHLELSRHARRPFGAGAAGKDGDREALRAAELKPMAAHAEATSLPKHARLRINEIFHSLQGEADSVGFRTVFVRLTGCPLRCQYCDTEYAFHAGDWHEIDSVLASVKSFDTPHVCVTGGEPLAQPNCLTLLERLCDAGHAVSLETSGAFSIADVDPRVVR